MLSGRRWSTAVSGLGGGQGGYGEGGRRKAGSFGFFAPDRLPRNIFFSSLPRRPHCSTSLKNTTEGLITPPDFVRVTSAAAAQAFNIYPRKGRVAAGSDADVIVLDPRQRHVISARTHHSRMDTNVYEGEECVSGAVCGFVCGCVVCLRVRACAPCACC